VIVAKDGESYTDEHNYKEAHFHKAKDNLLRPIFSNGTMLFEDTLSEIRNRLYPEGF
jgi:hypothetical protein